MVYFLAGMNLLLLFWAGAVSARLCLYKKQIRHMLKELEFANQSETNILFTSAVNIGQTPDVIDAVNCMMEKNRRNSAQLLHENRSYRESITGISHDIRTPLTSAKGYMQMIQKEGIPREKQVEYAKIVERRLADLTAMLDQLFLYARIEAREFVIHPETLNAGSLFADTVSMFYEDFCSKNCEPAIHLPKTPCWVYADRQALVRMIENLIKNALVHGTGHYELSLCQDGQRAVICISNETNSIELSDIDHIFERFYTTDLSRSRKTTGLGLAIVKELAGQMGGEVSASLNGNEFSITLCLPCADKSFGHGISQ